jgi:hypothetical protein
LRTVGSLQQKTLRQTLARLLEAREFAENALRYLDEARKHLTTKEPDVARALLPFAPLSCGQKGNIFKAGMPEMSPHGGMGISKNL